MRSLSAPLRLAAAGPLGAGEADGEGPRPNIAPITLSSIPPALTPRRERLKGALADLQRFAPLN